MTDNELFGISEQLDDNISRQEALRIFEEHCYPVRYDHNSIDKGMTLPGIVEVLNMTPSAQQWIPCSERLPDAGEYYFVTVQYYGWDCTECRTIDIAKYELDGWRSCHNVLAWCPLPEPWKGEKE